MRQVKLFGHTFRTGDEANFNSLIETHLTDKSVKTPLFLANHNVHSLYLLPKHQRFKEYYDYVDYIWLDGMPVVLMLRLLGHPVKTRHRLTFLDWQESFYKLANENSYRIFLLGGKDKVVEKATSQLSRMYPSIDFSFHHGYLDEQENLQVLAAIKEMQPDILLVGMGMPLQEQWIWNNRSTIAARVIMPIGGYFDYVAGNTYTPPRWAGKLGLEWFFRFASDPQRLAYRYMVEPWSVATRFFLYFLKTRVFGKAD